MRTSDNHRVPCLLGDGSPDPSRFKRQRYPRGVWCEICGKLFAPKRTAKFCSPTCRQRNHREMLKRLGVDR